MFRWRILLIAAVTVVALAAPAHAQRAPLAGRESHVGYIYPAGGQRGTEFDVILGGQFLDGASRAIVSGKGVEAKVVKHEKPISGKDMTEIRELVEKARKALQESGARLGRRGPAGGAEAVLKKARELGADPEKLRLFDEFRRARSDPRRQLNPQLSETVTLRVTIDGKAEPGRRELRLLTSWGLSNPLRFEVGQWPERCEPPADGRPAEGPTMGAAMGRVTNEKTTVDRLPVIVNGQIRPGDVDRVWFKARKGQRLVAAVAARDLMPYLADAVPGWFQATVAVVDAQGREVAYSDDYRFRPDPIVSCVIPKTGRYAVEIKDAIYRGREDFVYRVTLGDVPIVTSAFPLGARGGTAATVALAGWNLPAKQLTLAASDAVPGVRQVSVGNSRRSSNPIPLAIDTLPECVEQEPNEAREAPQRLRPPMIVNGRIGRPGDQDVFSFEGRAGGQVVVEVLARRLGSPLDSVLELTDAGGRRVAANDDCEDKADGLSTHHADSRLLATLPTAGLYYVRVADAQGRGGADFGYRLRMSARRPDFELRVVPSTINAPPGATAVITVYAMRRDGFDGDIALALVDPPEGFALGGAWVPAGADHVRLTLTVGTQPRDEPYRLQLEGRAAIGGREVVRQALPADDMMQAFIYRHLVPADEWMATVLARGWRRPRWTVPGKTPARLPVGSTAVVEVAGLRRLPAEGVQYVLDERPEGIAIDGVSATRRGVELHLRADAAKIKPGAKGNLIVDLFTERVVPGKNAKQETQKRRVLLGTLPAISYEVVAETPDVQRKPERRPKGWWE